MLRPRSWAVATEDLDQSIDNPELSPLAEVPSESFEHAILTTDQDINETEMMLRDGADLNDDIENMEAIAGVIEDNLEGGVSPSTIAMANVAVESFAAKWCVPYEKVATEDYDVEGGNKLMAQVALEGVGSAISSGIKRFIQWLKDLAAKGKDAWLNFTNAGKTLKKRAAKLKQAAGKLGEQTTDKVKGSFISDLVVDEKADYQFCVNMANGQMSSAAEIGKGLKVYLDHVIDQYRRDETDYGDGAAQFRATKSFGKATTSALAKSHLQALKTGNKTVERDSMVMALPGNAYLIQLVGDKTVQVAYVRGKMKDVKELPTLNAQDIMKGIGALEKIGDALESRLKDFRTFNEKLDALAETLSQGKKNASDQAEKADASRTGRAAIMTCKNLEKAVQNSLKFAGSGIAGYVAASIKAHGVGGGVMEDDGSVNPEMDALPAPAK